MIKNIVFDIGNVLAIFQPRQVLVEFFQSQKKADKLYALLFESNLWNEYDQGLLDGEGLKKKAGALCPDLKKEIDRFIPAWAAYVREIPGRVELIQDLRSEGYSVYILSNIPEDSYIYLQEHTHLFTYIDGGVFSYQDRLIKPNPAIFNLLIERYGLCPQECLFFDDRQENVDQAKNLGWKGILCTNPETLVDVVRKVLHEV